MRTVKDYGAVGDGLICNCCLFVRKKPRALNIIT